MARAGVEALGLLWCDVRELRHIGIWGAVVSCAVAVSLGLWLPSLPGRWTGCPSVLLDRVRGRAGAAVSWSPRDASPAEGAAGAPRSLRFARWAACETG